MEWFEQVKGTVKKTANKAYEKSSQVIEVTKINFQITEAESDIEKALKQLGMKVYEEYKNGSEISEEGTLVCQDIDGKYAKIETLKEQIAEIKNIKKCGKCGTINSQENNYCAKCGEKLED